MKEKWNTFKESLTDVMMMSKKEFLLTAAVCVLSGMVFGIFFSPKKSMVIGSNNGNNSGNNTGKDCDREEIEAENTDPDKIG